MNVQKYRAEAAELETVLHVGKSGILKVTDELKKQLKKKKIVKVKFLKSSFVEKDKDGLINELADLTGSQLIEIRGNTAVFCRKG